jgi:hypothetical protein
VVGATPFNVCTRTVGRAHPEQGGAAMATSREMSDWASATVGTTPLDDATRLTSATATIEPGWNDMPGWELVTVLSRYASSAE